MKTPVMILLLMLACATVLALDWEKCLEYKFPDGVPNRSWRLVSGTNGIYIADWSLTNPVPTQADLEAIEPAAIAWHSNKVAEAAANIPGMDLQMKSIIRALVKVVNDRLPAGQKITEDELKAAIKAEALK